MKITIELELSKREEMQLRQNCVQRMIQTAIRVGEEVERGEINQMTRELASTSHQDWDELGNLVDKIWRTVQNAIWSQDITTIKGGQHATESS